MPRKNNSKITKEDAVDRLRKAIGDRIRRRRNAESFTAQRIADNLGISRISVHNLESGKNNVSAVNLWKLACLFGCEVSDLVPDVAKDYKLTRSDKKKIAQVNELAVEWAEVLFG